MKNENAEQIPGEQINSYQASSYDGGYTLHYTHLQSKSRYTGYLGTSMAPFIILQQGVREGLHRSAMGC